MNKLTLLSAVISLALIAGALWLATAPAGNPETAVGTATVVNGTQYIDITAKGGYAPRVVTAKQGMPTVLRVSTSGTFDCSASLVIPKLSYQKFLKPSGTEEITISTAEARGTLQGLCAMGMYSFKIVFE